VRKTQNQDIKKIAPAHATIAQTYFQGQANARKGLRGISDETKSQRDGIASK
jgi:hypothetical protein